ncbi:hypothetical protein B0I35DRAFT_405814 [Stachybotrys elegans]|uniref:Nucleotide exchange factor SIL1 n=1 Tax=Stachybotrys elegans TaxID=80388 RepID=A0A8K0T0C2_9HYPO|nr:hypothetical protein B0I35DRAFT_405814 [Stachybotrys elegans]
MVAKQPGARPALLCLCMIFGFILCALAAPAAAQKPPPSSDVELICHTDDPKDCYPKVFQPTDEFQTVHDDQDIPNGLHVRLNIWTGQREAKINVPDEQDPSLEGLPVDQAVVIVDPEEPATPPIPKGAPAYDSVGKIKEPEHEAVGFAHALKLLKSGSGGSDPGFDDALEVMEDISHDIYYGLKITEDTDVLKGLFCLMADTSVPVTEGVVPRDQQAAGILASALQNNPSALKEVVKNWGDVASHQCVKDGPRVDETLFSSLVSPDASSNKRVAPKAKAKVGVINGLIKDDKIRAEFISSGGMQKLLEVLVPEGKEWAGAQRKVGQLVLDNFLDEDMGAKLGQWPKVPKQEDSRCRGAEGSPQEGCWDYHVERIMKENKGNSGHWSKDVHDRLAALRKAEDHKEL